MEFRAYRVVFERFKDEEGSGYNVSVPALPGCFTWGETLEEATSFAEEAIASWIEAAKAAGESIPEDAKGLARHADA